MSQEIMTISLGGVNCYLVKTGDGGYVMVDTGFRMRRSSLDIELEKAGCKPGNLRLIVITHGDFDHTGNAAYLRKKFGAKIAMHPGESEAVDRGNMICSRENRPFVSRIVLSLFRLSKSDRFKPDVYVDDGDDLTAYGFDAKVLHIPGHSKGSIGILTAGGAPSAGSGQVLFCGDLLANTNKPALGSIIDDPSTASASLEKLKSLEIRTVYPGHGRPFPMEALWQYRR
jgi:glyoxylase-like metal-dependent hydrolase (beta-lactamase superfamily II)